MSISWKSYFTTVAIYAALLSPIAIAVAWSQGHAAGYDDAWKECLAARRDICTRMDPKPQVGLLKSLDTRCGRLHPPASP